MYIKLALKEMKRHIFFDALIILLLAISFVLCMVMAGVVKYRFRYYSPFKDMLNQKGIFLMLEYGAVSGGDDSEYSPFVTNKKMIYESFEGVKEVAGMYQLSPTYYGYRRIFGWSYDEAMLNHFKPKMKAGRWLSEEDAESSTIVAVAAGDMLDVKVGDVVTLTEDITNHTLDVTIVGIIDEDERIVGTNINQYGVCEDYFSTPNHINGIGINGDTDFMKEKSYPTFFFVNDQLQKNPLFSDEGGGDGTGIQRIMTGPQFIIYDDSITEDELSANEKQLNLFNMIQKEDLEIIKENSIYYIMSNLNP